MKNKYTKTLLIVMAFLILTITTIASYAYFTASVSTSNTYNTVITSGTMQLLLEDDEQVSLKSALPGSSTTKTFKVKNTGTVQTTYDVYLSEVINLFDDKNDLVYTLTSANGCPNATETVVPESTGEQSKIVSSCSINPNQEHEYSLTITFKEDGTAQDDNKGKAFKAKLSINEYNTVAYLSNGNTFNNILSNMIRQATTNNSGFRAKTINRVDQQPDNNIEAINIADDSSDEEVLMWIDEDNINIYTNAKDIYLNKNCEYMFYYINMQTVDLRLFNPSLTTNMYEFFANSQIDEAIVGDYYDTSNVTNMQYMYEETSFDSYDFVNSLDYSSVKNIYKLFTKTKKETDIELKNIYFPKLTNIGYLFDSSNAKNIKITNVEAPNVNFANMMFKYSKAESIIFENSFTEGTSLNTLSEFVYYCDNLKTFDFGSFNIKGIENIGLLLNNCPKLTNINLGSNFDTSKTKQIYSTFSSLASLEELDLGEKFDTTNITEISSLVSGAPKLKKLHLGNKFNVTSTLRFGSLTHNCPLLETIYIGPDAKVYQNNDIYIFNGTENLVGGAGTRYSSEHDGVEYFRIDDPEHGKPGYLTLDPRYV